MCISVIQKESDLLETIVQARYKMDNWSRENFERCQQLKVEIERKEKSKFEQGWAHVSPCWTRIIKSSKFRH